MTLKGAKRENDNRERNCIICRSLQGVGMQVGLEKGKGVLYFLTNLKGRPERGKVYAQKIKEIWRGRCRKSHSGKKGKHVKTVKGRASDGGAVKIRKKERNGS